MTDIVPLFKALADARRLRIAGLISQKGLSAEEIAAAVDLAPATVAHHLGYLRRAGLVTEQRQQYYTVFRLNTQPLLDALRTLADQPVPPDLEDDLEKYDRKVLGDFLVDGKLKSIPSQRKKRDVILRLLAKRFEMGREYPEKEVNLIIAEYHDDFFTLRREMVDAGMMARDHGIYRLIAAEPSEDRRPVLG